MYEPSVSQARAAAATSAGVTDRWISNDRFHASGDPRYASDVARMFALVLIDSRLRTSDEMFRARTISSSSAVGPLAMSRAISSSTMRSTRARSAPGFAETVTVKRPAISLAPALANTLVASLLVVDQPLHETRAAIGGEDVGEHIEQRDVAVAVLRDVPDLGQPRRGHPVVGDFALRAGAARGPRLGMRDRRTGIERAEVALDPGARIFGLDVAGQHQDGVRRSVVGAEPFANLIERGAVEIVHRADHAVTVGMLFRIGGANDQVLRDRVRLVLALPFFVLHDAALLVEARVGQRADEVAHAIGFEPEDRVERFLRDRLVVVGPVGAGAAVLARSPRPGGWP